MRLVLDTSVIVSAFRSRNGASFRLLQLLRQDRFIAVATPTLLFEYESVMKRPQQRQAQALSDEQLENAICALAERLEAVQVDFRWKPNYPIPTTN